MKTKRALLVVEPTRKSMDRAFSVLARPSKRFAGAMIIAFPDFETLGRVITGARVQLLNCIRTRKPKSIQELARFVERDFKNVYEDVKLLAEFGLIELRANGPRRAAVPVARYRELVLAA